MSLPRKNLLYSVDKYIYKYYNLRCCKCKQWEKWKKEIMKEYKKPELIVYDNLNEVTGGVPSNVG